MEVLSLKNEGESLKRVLNGPPSVDWMFCPEVRVQGYAAADVELSLKFLKWVETADRLTAQRPLIHNGRKMKR